METYTRFGARGEFRDTEIALAQGILAPAHAQHDQQEMPCQRSVQRQEGGEFHAHQLVKVSRFVQSMMVEDPEQVIGSPEGPCADRCDCRRPVGRQRNTQ